VTETDVGRPNSAVAVSWRVVLVDLTANGEGTVTGFTPHAAVQIWKGSAKARQVVACLQLVPDKPWAQESR